jgi:threonine-phosphate decarboxylase
MQEFQLHGGDVYRRAGLLDFSANINPLGMPASVREAAVRGVQESERYPDPENEKLTRAYAQFHGVNREAIVFGNGAAELIRALPLCLRAKRGGLVFPCFGEYEAGMKLAGTEVEEVSYSGAKAGKIPQGLDLVMIGNPSNPDGRVFSRDEIARLAGAYPDTYFCVDESFLPFCADAGERSCIPCLKEYRNLLVLRSFTKICAMPGLRLGALLTGNRQISRSVRNFLQPWTVSRPAQNAGLASLSEKDFVSRTVRFLDGERPWLTGKIKELPYVDFVLPSPANFLLFHAREEQEHSLYRQLLDEGIQIRDCASFRGMQTLSDAAEKTGWYRIAVRTRNENERLLAAMRKVSLS